MTTPITGDGDFTELVDADIPRVDLVDKAANGLPFLLAKRDGGLLDPDLVRGLIGKSQPDPEPPAAETVTMTGSPAAIARIIHEAAQRSLAKATYDAADRTRMAADHQAMPDGSYPIADEADLRAAIHAVGRGGDDHAAIRRHIIARAKALGASSDIPDTWAADGSLKEGLAKAMDDDTPDALDTATVLAEPELDAPGAPTEPGSPAWEAIDAATACKWTAILARARNAIDLLAEREMLEAAAGDMDDAGQAMDLQDACCAIDYAISVLAPFAVAEHAEAEQGADRMQMVGKALADFDAQTLDTIEALSTITKAGRVLSTANEAAIRGAVESLQKVLASLPAAPTASDESGQPVAKEETVTDTTAAATVDEPLTKADDSGEEDRAPQVAVYDRHGRLVGVVDPSALVPVAEDDAPEKEADHEPDSPDEPAAEETPMEEAAEATPSDFEPQPADDAGTPADDVAKTTHPDQDADTFKSIATDIAKGILDEHSATQEQVIAKQAETIAQLAEAIEILKGQVQALEEQPAAPQVFTNGAMPPAHLLRGQDSGAPPVDVARARELKKGLYGGPDSHAQNDIANEMQGMAIARLQEIHQRGARQ